jgi:hypothetical protein
MHNQCLFITFIICKLHFHTEKVFHEMYPNQITARHTNTFILPFKITIALKWHKKSSNPHLGDHYDHNPTLFKRR